MKTLFILFLVTVLSACNSTAVYQGYLVDQEKNQVFYGDGNPFAQALNKQQRVVNRALVNADMPTFKKLDNNGYAKDKNFVYYYGKTVPFAVPASFKKLSDEVSIDNKHVFLRAKPIEGASPSDVKILEESRWGVDETYILSQGKVYLNHGEISFTPCDPKSFRVLSRVSYTKDNTCVYYKGVKIEGAKPKTFKTKGWSFSVDAKNVFYKSKKLEQVSPNKFRTLSYDYAKNKSFVFYKDERLEGVRTKYFESLRYGYAKNIDGVFFEGKRLEGADRKSFRAKYFSNGYDKNHCYHKRIKVDCETNKPLNAKEKSKEPSIFDGINLRKRLTHKEQNDTVATMVDNLIKRNKLQIEKLDAQLPDILQKQKAKYKGKYLTPQQVKNIDLSKLAPGFNYYLYSPASPRKSLHYEFRGIDNNITTFAIHSVDSFGALIENRTLTGNIIKSSIPIYKSANTVTYSPFKCTFQIGDCRYSEKALYSDTPINKKVHVKYDNGFWIKKTKRPNSTETEEVFMFDQYGFTLLHVVKKKGKMSKLWLRVEK